MVKTQRHPDRFYLDCGLHHAALCFLPKDKNSPLKNDKYFSHITYPALGENLIFLLNGSRFLSGVTGVQTDADYGFVCIFLLIIWS